MVRCAWLQSLLPKPFSHLISFPEFSVCRTCLGIILLYKIRYRRNRYSIIKMKPLFLKKCVQMPQYTSGKPPQVAAANTYGLSASTFISSTNSATVLGTPQKYVGKTRPICRLLHFVPLYFDMGSNSPSILSAMMFAIRRLLPVAEK